MSIKTGPKGNGTHRVQQESCTLGAVSESAQVCPTHTACHRGTPCYTSSHLRLTDGISSDSFSFAISGKISGLLLTLLMSRPTAHSSPLLFLKNKMHSSSAKMKINICF